MTKPYDQTLKFLLDHYPGDLLGHLLGLAVAGPVAYLDTELRADARTADALLQVPLADRPPALVHLEVQTRYAAAVPDRMLDYAVRIFRKHHQPVQSWLMVLLPPAASQEPLADGVGWGDPAVGPGLRFRYHLIRVWDLDPAIGLAHPGLLPLVPLMRGTAPAGEVLDSCAARADAWATTAVERDNLLACVGNLASLRYDQDVIQAWARRCGMPIETPMMQWIRDAAELRSRIDDLLMIVQTRGLACSDAQRDRIMACTDAVQVKDWIRRAITATSVDEVLA